jgi:virulence factor Mce-like protein
MNKNGPRLSQIVLMVLFALSSFGLLLFLWTSFGGNVPLKPKPYTATVDFAQGSQLASYADVRISGISVGKAARIQHDGKRVRVTLEIQPEYAPLPRDTKATLRTKTVVGETYVELSFGRRRGPFVADGGRLPSTAAVRATDLDDVLDVFDRETRPRFQGMIASFARAIDGRGDALNGAIGNAGPALEAAEPVLQTVARQSRAVRSGVRDLGTTFGTIGEQQGAVRRLIADGRRLVASTAGDADALRATVRELPGTLDQARTTLRSARALAVDAAPAVRDLRPVAPLIRPTARDLGALAPDLRAAVLRLDETLPRLDAGFPAIARVLDAIGPLADELEPFTDDALPMLRYLRLYRKEIGVSFANTAAATQLTTTTSDGVLRHLVRVDPPVNSNQLAGVTKRPPADRNNPYPLPGGLSELGKGGLKAADCSNVRNPPTLLGILDVFGQPPCRAQEPLTFDGVTSQFPRLLRDAQVATPRAGR